MPPRKSTASSIVAPSEAAEAQLRESLSSHGDLKNMPVADVLSHLGFKKIQYSEIPPEVRDSICEVLREEDMRNCYGMPRLDMFAGVTPWPENFQVSASDDFGTIYFYFDIADSSRRHINMSQVRRTDKSYLIIPIAQDAEIDDCISSIASNEQTRLILSSRHALREL